MITKNNENIIENSEIQMKIATFVYTNKKIVCLMKNKWIFAKIIQNWFKSEEDSNFPKISTEFKLLKGITKTIKFRWQFDGT